MFLTPDQIRALTERKRPSAQIKWLKEHGYPFDVGACGNPKVLVSVVESRLGGSISNPDGDFKLRLDDDEAA